MRHPELQMQQQPQNQSTSKSTTAVVSSPVAMRQSQPHELESMTPRERLGHPPNGITSLGVCYAPQGAIASANIGPTGGSTWLKAAMSYNDRLQSNQIQYLNQAGNLMQLQYSFVDASSHNNGNVMGITNLVDGTRSQQFTYDQLNRLFTAETTSNYSTSPTHCWGETYVYDNVTTISPPPRRVWQPHQHQRSFHRLQRLHTGKP